MPKKLTQEEFERKIKEIHGDNIDVSNVKYNNSWTYIHCKCNNCGNEWDVKPNTLFNGHGCRKCYDKKNSENRKQSIDEVNKRIKEKGNNTEVIGEYVDTKHNALVRCNVCGYEWRTKPNLLYRSKNGCPNCGKLSMTNEEFVTFCKEKYDDIYDFSETVFKGKTNNVIVKCRKDNKYFEVKANSLLNDIKRELCPFCKEEKRLKKEQEILSKKLRLEELRKIKEEDKKNKIIEPRGYNTETFIKKLKTSIYPNEDYDYSKTIFNGLREPVTCHCNKHNIDFIKDAYSLLVGRGCHLCKRSGRKFTTEEWKILAKEKYPNFDYDNVDYINKSTKVKYMLP